MRFLIIGWTIALLAMMLISGATSGWVILLFWGLFCLLGPIPLSRITASVHVHAGSHRLTGAPPHNATRLGRPAVPPECPSRVA